MLEQLKIADVLVHYDDVQFSKGSFTNRVQVKTQAGIRWLTIPLAKHQLKSRIKDVECKPVSDWKDTHISFLEQSLAGSPYQVDAMEIVTKVYDAEHRTISGLARDSMLAVADYFGLLAKVRCLDSEDLNIGGNSSQRVSDIVEFLDGDVYVTGHGASKYLDHEIFVNKGIEVRYMNYSCQPYPQLHGEFTPYVTSLDLIANCGKSGAQYIQPKTVSSVEFLHGPK